MPKLDTLEEKYREAQDAFRSERTDENKRAYKKAKKAFADARVEVRQQEEADPNHPRGSGVAFVANDANEEEDN